MKNAPVAQSELDGRVDRIISVLPKIMSSIGLMRIHPHPALKLDLTFSQFQALVFIFEMGRCSIRELAERLHVAQSTTSQLVDRLVKAGVVGRETSKGDRRRMVVTLNQKGKNMVEKRKSAMRESYKRFLSILNEDDQKSFEQAFFTINGFAAKIENHMNSIIPSSKK